MYIPKKVSHTSGGQNLLDVLDFMDKMKKVNKAASKQIEAGLGCWLGDCFVAGTDRSIAR